jgi:DNA invertase Pin-like site-specific DNA recombinase
MTTTEALLLVVGAVMLPAAACGVRQALRRRREAPGEQPDAEPMRRAPAMLPAPPLPARGRKIAGYGSWDGRGGVHAPEFRGQAEQISAECKRLGLTLVELVREREPRRGRALERPGLGYVLGTISHGDAEGLIVAELSRLAHSVAELGRVLEWFAERDARLIAVREGLDTDRDSGLVAVRTIIGLSRWERERLVERTRNGMLAARRKGPPGVADYPELKERIAQMRASGMTLEAIAAQLNGEGTPTVRGGAKWRPSSVQVAAGYRRPPAGHRSRWHLRGNEGDPSSGTQA